MSATIIANCECCGDFRSTSREVVIRFVEDEEEARYRLDCPGCDTPVVKKVKKDKVDSLIRYGAESETWASLNHMEEYDRIQVKFRESINDVVTVLEFKDYLETNDWFSGLYAETREQMLRNEAGFEKIELDPYNDGPAGDIKNV